jgi:hypothetical protein
MNRHPLCLTFEQFLDAVIADQDTGDGHGAEAMNAEFGISLTACVMQAVGIRRLRLKHATTYGKGLAQELADTSREAIEAMQKIIP